MAPSRGGSPHADVDDLCEICQTIDFSAASRLNSSEIIFESEEGWLFRDHGNCPLCTLCHWVWDATNTIKPTFSVTLCVWSIRAEHPRFYMQLLSRRRGHQATDVGLASWHMNLSVDDEDGIVVDPYINYTWLSERLEGLQDDMATTRCETLTRSPRAATKIRLLDCYSLAIVDATTDAEYVALSYVIGRSSSRQRRPEHATGRVTLEYAPRTIRDAIEFTKNLGKQYLWVDRYCIQYNDTIELRGELAKMASIFANAWATVVSLGSNCNEAIPGVSHERTVPFSTRTQHGTLGLDLGSLGTVISHTTYATRGWVLQECLLSKCLIYATDGAAAVMHASGAFCEYVESSQLIDSGWLDARSGWMNANRPISSSGSEMTIRHFFRHIKDFCSRNLTRESDALDAIRGYLNILPWKSLWGIVCLDVGPGKDLADSSNTALGFCIGLLWTNSHVKIYTHGGSFDEMEWAPRPAEMVTKSNAFPSWSWASSRWGTLYDLLPRTEQEFTVENFATAAQICVIRANGEGLPLNVFLDSHSGGQLLSEETRLLEIKAPTIEYTVSESPSSKRRISLNSMDSAATKAVELIRTQIFQDYHTLPTQPPHKPPEKKFSLAMVLATSDSKTLDRRSKTLWTVAVEDREGLWYRTGLIVFDLSVKPGYENNLADRWNEVEKFVADLPMQTFLLG
ncbi:uncharacterized protein AB675_1527 [Cyphellophora attinorum]|uniref:Heterokaryon incompatibility domain-containing protein n=1 Tax=Cyphellophora attinorum TaxID=1664694 RepID=A0A0N0NJP4_9EURO|nr:uncharacterized protein AB675_1527 [Phialophora attinorum]KPI37211.1 hypothetical protein AB675_1527 [Phialophora attinorum]